ncbi:hypothetical protein D3C71_1267140 [compost metagenome]
MRLSKSSATDVLWARRLPSRTNWSISGNFCSACEHVNRSSLPSIAVGTNKSVSRSAYTRLPACLSSSIVDETIFPQCRMGSVASNIMQLIIKDENLSFTLTLHLSAYVLISSILPAIARVNSVHLMRQYVSPVTSLANSRSFRA